ncbi:MAG: hypothetical protein ACOX4U_08385 [Anaerovoracaceae bacterium]|jgi:hypothetical protein
MRRDWKFKILTILVLLLFILSGCEKGGTVNSGDTEWKYEKTIVNPIIVFSADKEVRLGSLDNDGVEVIIPANTFPTPTEVTLENPNNTPKYPSKEMLGFGSPINISAGDSSVRLLEPVTIRMKFNPADLNDADLEAGSLYFGYFNGKNWQYIKPEVDMENQIMTFTTCHFSLFGTTKITIDKRIEQYTSNKALADWAQEQSDELTNSAAEAVIDHILKEKLGIDDEKTKGQVLGSLLKDDEWGDMVKGLYEGDVPGFNKSLQILVGKKIVDNVPASKLSKSLKGLTSDFGVATVEKASEAAGYLAEGQYTNAAQIIGEHIADQFMITTAGKIAVAAIEHRIDTWKNEEIEAAYQVFKNGASSKVPWWGYNVEKGNFEELWEQMGGAARQLEIEAIAAQEKVRKEAGMPPLDNNEKEKIRKLVQKNLKRQFEERVKTDAEIAKKEAEYKMLTDMYKEDGFLDKGRWGWEKDYELEQRLDILLHFKDKVLRDTGRIEIKEGQGSTKDAISIKDLSLLSMYWFGTDNPKERQEKYAEFLKKNYGISLYPAAEKLNGTWSSGSLAITGYNINFGEKASTDSEDGFGCDLGIDLKAALDEMIEENKTNPAKLGITLQLDANGSGTMVVKLFDDAASDDTITLNATYTDGAISAKGSLEEGIMTMNGKISEDGGNISINGQFKLSGGSEWIGGTWKATK